MSLRTSSLKNCTTKAGNIKTLLKFPGTALSLIPVAICRLCIRESIQKGITDGYAPYPAEKEAMDIPVLWMINNEKSNPPWGRVVRFIKEDEKKAFGK